MSIDEPLLTLDIIGASGNVITENCSLRENKTNLAVRNSLDYIVSYRDSILSSRGYRVPEAWDHEWNVKDGPIWAPDSIAANLETWVCPEFFKAETNNPTLCIEATNRVDSTVGFEQTNVTVMPQLIRNTELRNFEGLVFDGTNDNMRGNSNTSWNSSTADFLIGIMSKSTVLSSTCPIVAKKGGDIFLVDVRNTGVTTYIDFSLNSNTISVLISGAAANPISIIVCGRMAGVPFLYANGTEVTGTLDTIDLDHNSKPWLGDRVLNSAEFKGTIHEVIFVNDNLSGSSVVDTDLKEKVAGYLAHKYNKTTLLESGHTYKNKPPRASVI
jgi:hypothetical protein